MSTVLPCNFRLSLLRNIKCSAKTNVQSHSVFNSSGWRQFFSLKIISILSLRLKNCNKTLLLPLNCCVAQVRIFIFFFWQKFMVCPWDQMSSPVELVNQWDMIDSNSFCKVPANEQQWVTTGYKHLTLSQALWICPTKPFLPHIYF